MSNYINTVTLHHEKYPSDSHYPFSLTIFNQTRQMQFETDEHFLRCIVYIDLEMVRAGVVEHRKDMPHGGYIEIQRPRHKNILMDYGAFAHFCDYIDWVNFQSAHGSWIETTLSENQIKGMNLGHKA